MEKENCQRKVSKGCLQMWILSLLLWNLVADELLQILVREQIFAVAYVDDFAILIKGKFEIVSTDLIDRGLNLVRVWC